MAGSAGDDTEATLIRHTDGSEVAAGKESRMRLFTIALPLDPLAAGQAVHRAAWPAHITLIGNFRAPDDAEIEMAVCRFAATTPPLRGAVEEEAWFGPDCAVLVDLVEVPLLRALHTQLLSELEAKIPELEMLLPLHTHDGYRPHRTVTADPRPSRGDVLTAARVSLAELDPSCRPGVAVVLGIWPLRGVSQHAWVPRAGELDVSRAGE